MQILDSIDWMFYFWTKSHQVNGIKYVTMFDFIEKRKNEHRVQNKLIYGGLI